eukprot:CAMPEP_0179418976 /NCGR_PEP_ID=MMETSP0799-20121207/8334_1 /TAXON_ID=46947 /ORGANISM="Geminigera cryophila, Strain CCMP2564" /LENGTH=334 /DNA_ID=CAMNT_0021192381 /DNA_START=247 /DNA_END=1248 /DNA_ORIENTATION=-
MLRVCTRICTLVVVCVLAPWWSVQSFRTTSFKPVRMRRAGQPPLAASRQREGTVEFDSGDCFYRPHSKIIRDMGVLALRVLPQQRLNGARARNHSGDGGGGAGELDGRGISVLDAMCGSGIRALRYIEEGGARYVVANDADDDTQLANARAANLGKHIVAGSVALQCGDAMDAYFAARLERSYYDMIDADGFGSGMPHSAEAWWALRLGGLLYLCSTDARTAAGKNSAAAAWRGFGAVAQSMPSSNELGVRLLVADAVRQAAARGMEAVPVFGVYHRPSSCARVMMRLVAAGRHSCPSSAEKSMGFAAYCALTGEHWILSLSDIHDPRAAAVCP